MRPLTVTKPEAMSASAWRREAIPARAIIFCKRSSMAAARLSHDRITEDGHGSESRSGEDSDITHSTVCGWKGDPGALGLLRVSRSSSLCFFRRSGDIPARRQVRCLSGGFGHALAELGEVVLTGPG